MLVSPRSTQAQRSFSLHKHHNLHAHKLWPSSWKPASLMTVIPVRHCGKTYRQGCSFAQIQAMKEIAFIRITLTQEKLMHSLKYFLKATWSSWLWCLLQKPSFQKYYTLFYPNFERTDLRPLFYWFKFCCLRLKLFVPYPFLLEWRANMSIMSPKPTLKKAMQFHEHIMVNLPKESQQIQSWGISSRKGEASPHRKQEDTLLDMAILVLGCAYFHGCGCWLPHNLFRANNGSL